MCRRPWGLNHALSYGHRSPHVQRAHRATKKAFYQRLYRDFAELLGIGAIDLEITVVETPRHDWGIRGQAGDELTSSYRVEQ
ncbi:tautomerase family protein [Paenibacillus sp. TRM 82003]|nr:tautomerase family protein [Paenibacillus sp. TRM 82003]